MPSKVLTHVENHVGLITSVLAATFVGFRVMSAAGWDPITARVILTTQGAPSVLAGTLVSLVPVLPVVAVSLIMLMVARQTGRPPTMVLILVGILFGLYLLLIAWPVALAFLVVAAVMLVHDLSRRKKPREPLDPDKRSKSVGFWTKWMLGYTGVLVLTIALSPEPWLPAEELRTPLGERVGYVLFEDADQAVILINRPRTVIRVQGDIERVRYCRPHLLDGPISRRIGDFIRASPVVATDTETYPTCDISSD